MNCKKCNYLLLEDATFCIECGTKIEYSNPIHHTVEVIKEIQTIEKQKIFCRNCAKELEQNSYACIGCGLAPMKGKLHCNCCGASTHPEAIICIKCGVKLLNDSTNSFNTGTNNLSAINFFDNNCFKEIGFWGSLLTFIGFFLPWVEILVFSGNGFTVSTKMLGDFAPLRILLITIPIISILTLLHNINGSIYDYYKVIKAIPLGLLLVTIATILIKINDFDAFINGELIQVISYGFYITFIGSILLSISKNYKL